MYSREIDGKTLHLTPSGWTYGKNIQKSLFVLLDKETESLWFPMEIEGKRGLVGIGGVYKDRMLKEIQLMSEQNWTKWKKTFPDTKFVHD